MVVNTCSSNLEKVKKNLNKQYMQKYKCEVHKFVKGYHLPELITGEIEAKNETEAKKRLLKIVDLVMVQNKDNLSMVVGLLNKEMVICK